MHSGFRRLAAKAMGVVAFGLALWLFVAVNLFSFPPADGRAGDAPEPVDAVVLLGGNGRERLPLALDEVRRRAGAPTLVLSTTDTPGNVPTDEICHNVAARVAGISDEVRNKPEGIGAIECFHPAPRNTRGETEAIRRIVERHGWQRVLVVTSSYHVPRARLLMSQCLDADVSMAGSQPQMSGWLWLRRYVVETGGLLDVALQPECPTG